MSEVLLELDKVSKYYTGAQSVVVGLNTVSLTLCRGEFVAITGESGSGKSTLAHVLGGILPYESGELKFRGKPTSHYGGLDWERYRRDNISFISQNYGILPGATVMRNVMSALVIVGMEAAQARDAAGDILRRVDLWELRNRRAAKLSSGQKQRLSIARALAKPSPILIADEPTGNLDAENSKRIIELLAGAARDRLVILVTHEFDEAKDLATRHIVIQDGRVAADTQLRPMPEPGPAPQAPGGQRRGLSFFVAKLQCLSRPVWTGIMSLFFAVTAFAVFVFLGVLLSSLDDTSTRKYDRSVFRNGDPARILVLGQLASAPNDEDYETFLRLPHVEEVETWGGFADVQYAYRKGVDFDAVYHEDYQENPFTGEITRHTLTTYYKMRDDAPYCKTVPVLPEGETFLTQGRLPENMYEVVSADAGHKVGDVITVLLAEGNIMNVDNYGHLQMSLQVVGLTDRGQGLYFHQDMARMFRQATIINAQTAVDHGFMYIPNNPLNVEVSESTGSTTVAEDGHEIHEYVVSNETPRVEEGTFRGDSSCFFSRLNPKHGSAKIPGVDSFASITFRSDEQEPDGSFREITLLPAVSDREPDKMLFDSYYGINGRVLLVDYNAFDTLCWKRSDEAGLTITDYAYTDEVLKALDELGYSAISVYRQGSVEQVPELEAQRIQTIRLSAAVLVILAILQVVVLRTMFSAQTESYRLLGNIGLTGRTAKQSVVIQTALFTAAGEIIGGTGIALCGLFGVRRVVNILKYLTAPYILLLVAAHITLSAIATVWIVRALGKQVYPLGTERLDIDLGKEEEAEA